MSHFLYVLRLVPRLHGEANWTDSDRNTVEQHFLRLEQACKAGQVILAGRTEEPLDETFGLVIFEAPNAEIAMTFMQSDPTVAAGIMTAELHPYSLALLRHANDA